MHIDDLQEVKNLNKYIASEKLLKISAGEQSWMTIMFKWFVWVIVFIPFCVTLWDLLLSEEMNLTVEAPMMELSREPKKSRSMAELARNQNIFLYQMLFTIEIKIKFF